MDRHYEGYWHDYYLKNKAKIRAQQTQEKPKRIRMYWYTVVAPDGKVRRFKTACECAKFFGFCTSWVQKKMRGCNERVILNYKVTKERRVYENE